MSETFKRGILSRQEIKAVARERVSVNRWPMVGVLVIVALIPGVASFIPIIGFVAAFVLSPVLNVQSAGFFLDCWRGENPPFDRVLDGLSDRFGTKLGGMLWMNLKIFLWSLLLVVPGIIKSFAYMLTPYLLARYPGVEAMKASELSERITQGHKMDLFVMGLSFLGWILLSPFTLGLLTLFHVGPYMSTSMAGMCDELIQNALQEGRITQEMLDGGNAQTAFES